MPIKKRTTLYGTGPADADPVAPKKKTPAPIPAAPPPQPIKKKELMIKKRSDLETSKWVYRDNGTLSIKTPAAATNWPLDFRKRIVSFYREPGKSIPARDYNEVHDSNTRVFHIQGVAVRVHYHFTSLGTTHATIGVIEVHRIDTGEFFILSNSNPAMRCLMVYSFLLGEHIGGVPKFRVYSKKTP